MNYFPGADQLHHFGANNLASSRRFFINTFMQTFKTYLQQEFVKRTAKNPSYSLRAFAQKLGLSHATLSSMMAGKRKITEQSFRKLAKALDMSPNELMRFQSSNHSHESSANYFVIQQDAFAIMSEWYFDAILELSLIPSFRLEPAIIAKSIGITAMQAKIALETLERLELIFKDKNGNHKLQHQNSINLLDPDFTSAANRKYQKSVLEKSVDALETIDRKRRDHTSTTMAINIQDLPKAKELIQKFRHDLNAFMQREKVRPDEVYQLQVSFFPLTQNSIKNETE